MMWMHMVVLLHLSTERMIARFLAVSAALNLRTVEAPSLIYIVSLRLGRTRACMDERLTSQDWLRRKMPPKLLEIDIVVCFVFGRRECFSFRD